MTDVEVMATDTSQPDSENRKQNPLGKIPTLLADGKAIYDSRVILEYLDNKAGGGKLFPPASQSAQIFWYRARWQMALWMQAF